MLSRAIAPLFAITLFSPISPTLAQDSRIERTAQPYQCEDSTVTKMGYYFEGMPDSGIYAVFATKLGVEQFPDTNASVVDRGMPLNSVMAKQNVADKVQVCLLSIPPQDQYCNPEKDSRGRVYRVYNYRLKAAYTGWNANHSCGGA